MNIRETVDAIKLHPSFRKANDDWISCWESGVVGIFKCDDWKNSLVEREKAPTHADAGKMVYVKRDFFDDWLPEPERLVGLTKNGMFVTEDSDEDVEEFAHAKLAKKEQ